jgi:cytochrome P450
MDNIRFVSQDIIKELPHMVESWWNITADVVDKVNSGFINNLSVSSGEWFDFSLVQIQSLRHGIDVFQTWWIVLIIVLFAASVPLLLVHYRTEKRIRNLTSNIPGPLTLPVLGNVPTLTSSNLVELFQKLVEAVYKYGPVVRFLTGDKLYIVISDAESIEKILTNKAQTKKITSDSKIVNGSALSAPVVEKWKIHRTIISSTFNNNVLDQFVRNFFESSLKLTQKLKLSANGSSFDIYPLVCACTLDIICETTMGTSVSRQMEGDEVFVGKLLNGLMELGGTLKNPWIMNGFIQNRKKQHDAHEENSLKYLHEFIDNVITEKLTSRNNELRQNRGHHQVEYVQWIRGKEVRLLDLLMQDAQLTVEEIRDELCTLMVASTKVAVACCYVLHLLGVHQEEQDKVLEEQEKIFGDDVHRTATRKDLCNMNYLEQVGGFRTQDSVISMH